MIWLFVEELTLRAFLKTPLSPLFMSMILQVQFINSIYFSLKVYEDRHWCDELDCRSWRLWVAQGEVNLTKIS